MATILFSFCDADRFQILVGLQAHHWDFSSSFCQGRIKHIHENMPKNTIEPTPKFDCHLSKSANRVTSLLSYRAFELTQVNIGCFSFIYCFIKAMFHVLLFPGQKLSAVMCLSCCLLAIFLRVCFWWDQGTTQARLPLRCGFLSVQRQGSCSNSYDCTQVSIPAGNGEKKASFFSRRVASLQCFVFVNKISVSLLNRFNTISPEGSKGKTFFFKSCIFDKYVMKQPSHYAWSWIGAMSVYKAHFTPWVENYFN